MSTMESYQQLDRKIIRVWVLQRILVFFTLVAIMTGVMIAIRETSNDNYIIFYMSAGMICLYTLVGVIVYPAIEYRQWRYQITEDKVLIRHGIFYVRTKIIPIARIQHITMTQGPLYRHYHLAKVEISVASGKHEIEGLNEELAAAISESLKNKLLTRLKAVQETGAV